MMERGRAWSPPPLSLEEETVQNDGTDHYRVERRTSWNQATQRRAQRGYAREGDQYRYVVVNRDTGREEGLSYDDPYFAQRAAEDLEARLTRGGGRR